MTRNMHPFRTGLVAVLLLLCAHAASAELVSWKVEGDNRVAIVFAPAAFPAGGRAPLVLSFHGRGDDIQNFQHTDLHLAWPTRSSCTSRGWRLAIGLPAGRWSVANPTTAT